MIPLVYWLWFSHPDGWVVECGWYILAEVVELVEYLVGPWIMLLWCGDGG